MPLFFAISFGGYKSFSYLCPVITKAKDMKRRIIFATLLSIVLLAGCDKDELRLTPMSQMYEESVGLYTASRDSILNFSDKFTGYVETHPESREGFYFDPTRKNLHQAAKENGVTLSAHTIAVIWNDSK
jgi:hypothetical protein